MKNENNKYTETLLNCYTEENLTKISRRIIEAYKAKQYSYIIGLCNLIDDSIVKNSKNVQKLFSHLIMLYHPDKLNQYKNEISSLVNQNKVNELNKYKHILVTIENIDKIQTTKAEINLEYDIEYEYGYDAEDFDSIISESELNEDYLTEDKNFGIDFTSLIRYKEMGNIEEVLPSYYFEELEGELNLSNSNLTDLSGLENCINISSLDLSNNQIIYINQIGFLEQITEINLSGNVIQFIDVLANLNNLQKLDLSFNEIDDISSIYRLPNLEYVNIIGNNIPEEQIEKLKRKKLILIN